MNIIFITLSNIRDISHPGIYADLMRKFRDEGHKVYIISPTERRGEQKTCLIDVDNVKILKVRTLNIQKTNIVEKGIGTLLLERQYQRAIQRYLGQIQFDLILYSTPPITFTNVVKYLKRMNPKAVSYLLLKDIFPQNAVDLGLMTDSVHGSWLTVHGWVDRIQYQLYNYFRKEEKALYEASDFIGCMSPANVEFIRSHHPYYPADRVEVAPNSIEVPSPPKGENFENEDDRVLREKNERYYIRKKYDLPTDKPIFIYGGNLGKPQGIDFLIQCLEANKNREDCYFVVVGKGTEYGKIASWMSDVRGKKADVCVKVMQRLPKDDYDMLVRSCDVGLIFLDHRFTIPNYPSRLLPYLRYKIPIMCCTDPNTDIGRIAEDNGYGYWCESNDTTSFTAMLDKMLASDRKDMGEKGYQFLCNNYTVNNTYDVIIKHVN